MKKLSILTIIMVLSLGTMYGQKNKQKDKTMLNQTEKVSYFLGAEVGTYYRTNKIEINSDKFTQGFVDALADKANFTEEEKQEIIAILQKMQQEAAQEMIKENKEIGRKFLEENKKNKDVKETASGLQYKVVKSSESGVSPKATDQVKVHYHGTLIDGTVFDSSVQRGQDITFGLNQVIRGWTEGLQLMKTGEKFIFYIPSDLAYGDQGAGQQIPGGTTLIFEVELFEVNPE